MKLTKESVCVYIENEAQLEEARELLKKYGERQCEEEMWLRYKYLSFDRYDREWYIGMLFSGDKQITLQELETILNEVK